MGFGIWDLGFGIWDLKFVVHLRAWATGVLECRADLHSLDRGNGHHRRSQPGVEPPVPVDVTPQPDRNACGDDDEDAAEGVACLPRCVNRRPHPPGGLLVRTAHVAFFGQCPEFLRRQVGNRRDDAADLDDVTTDSDAEDGKELLRQPAHGHPRSRLPRAGPLQHRPRVVETVLDHTGVVGVAGAGHRQAGQVARGPAVAPVGPIAVDDAQRDRGARRPAGDDAAQDLHLVPLDLHPPAATVAGLPPGQVAVDRLHIHLQSRRQPLHDGNQARAVGFAGGQES